MFSKKWLVAFEVVVKLEATSGLPECPVAAPLREGTAVAAPSSMATVSPANKTMQKVFRIELWLLLPFPECLRIQFSGQAA
jgi:hypothetical protein